MQLLYYSLSPKASYNEKFDRVSLARMTLVIRECRTKGARMKFDRDRY